MATTAIQLLIQYKYILVIPITIVEGPIAMMGTGFLLRIGHFSFWPLYFSLMLGDLIGDVGWYCLGYFGGMPFIRRFGKYFNITINGVNKVERIFHRYHSTILFVSKITMGLGFAVVTLFTAGLSRVPFWRYLIFNIVGGFIWTLILVSIGYYLGDIYLTVGRGLEIVTLVVSVIIIAVLGYGFSRYIKQRFTNI